MRPPVSAIIAAVKLTTGLSNEQLGNFNARRREFADARKLIYMIGIGEGHGPSAISRVLGCDHSSVTKGNLDGHKPKAFKRIAPKLCETYKLIRHWEQHGSGKHWIWRRAELTY